MAALELKAIPGLPATLFLVSALSAVAYRHMVLALLESICLQVPMLLAQNGVASTCVAGGSAFLVVIAAIRCSSESYSFTMYLRILGPGRASLVLGRILQRPNVPYLEDLNLPASWVLVDYLTWTPKAGGAIPVNAQTEPNYCTSGASQESSRACCAAIDVHQTHSADSTAAAKQGATRAGRRASKARARLQAQDVHIVRPSGLHRTASCPEEAARDLAGQPRGGRRAAAALRSHSLGSEAREDLGSQQRSLPPAGASGSLRSHSLELPSDDGVPCLASHAVDVDGSEAGSTRGSFADLTSLAEAETGSTDGLDSGDSMASAASSLSLPDDLAFQDALAPQGGDAVSSLGMDGDCPAAVRAACPEAYLLQFGALLNEASAIEALREQGLPSAWGSERACFGLPDAEHSSGSVPWEPICEEASPGVAYAAWRRPLRAGLFLYRTRAIIAGVAPADVRRFHFDDEARHDWDETLLELERLPSSGCGDNCIISYRAKWPRPFSARDYVYGRRVWARPADGGCYSVSAGTDVAAAPTTAAGRAVRVRDFASCLLIRAAPGCPGATEVAAVYFEDPCLRPGIMNLAVRKGLWPYLLKYVAALRSHSAAASLHSPSQQGGTSDGQPSQQRAAQDSRSRAASRRRSLSRSQRRQQQQNGLQKTVSLFRRRSLFLTATILAVLF